MGLSPRLVGSRCPERGRRQCCVIGCDGEVYYRRTMGRAEQAATVLTIRVGADLSRALTREARRRRKTKSEVAREILAAGLAVEGENLIAQEARRQSLLVSGRRSEEEALEFIEQAADARGWK